MTSESLIKLSGVALILSGVLATIGFSIHPHDSAGSNHGLWVGGHILIITGFFMGLLGLAGLYGLMSARIGSVGFIGFLIAAVSLVLYLGKLYWSGFLYPLVIEQHPEFISAYGFNPGSNPVDPVVKTVFYLGPILFAVGYTLLGLGLLRGRVLPRFPVWLVMVGSLLVGLWPLLPAVVQHLSVFVSVIYTVGIAWIGYLLTSGKYRTTYAVSVT